MTNYRVLLMAMPDTVVSIDNAFQVPNLAIASLAGNLDNCEVKIQDLVCIRKNTRKFIHSTIEEYKPDLVGLSSMTFQFETAKKIAQLIKNINPRSKIVLGGYHGSLMYDDICQTPETKDIDYIIRGEGELTLNDLVQQLQSTNPDLKKVPGLSFRTNGSFTHTPPRPLIQDIDKIRLPLRSARIIDNCKMMERLKFDVAEASRGCYLNCQFCSITKMYGKNFRRFSVERIIEDLQSSAARGAKHIFFTDDNLTLDTDHFEQLCEAICEAGLDKIRYSIQASSVGIAKNERLAKKMARAGFETVFLGIENVSSKNLTKVLKKGNIVDYSRKAVQYLHKYDIAIIGGFIIGNPDDTEKHIVDNYRFAKELKIDILYTQYLNPYPKTDVRTNLLKENLIVNENDFTKYNGFYCNVRTKNLSKEDLLRINSREAFKFILWWLNPKNLIRHKYFKHYFVKDFWKFYWAHLLFGKWVRGLISSCLRKSTKPWEFR